MNIRPFGRNMWVSPKKKDRILVADTKKAPHELYGEVLAIGKDVKEAKVGDTIIFTKFGFDEVEVNGELVFIVRETDEDFLGVVENA